jgi:hypothetical protein
MAAKTKTRTKGTSMDAEIFHRLPDFMIAWVILVPGNVVKLRGGRVGYRWNHRGFRSILDLIAFQKGLRREYGDRAVTREMVSRDLRTR